MGEHHHEPGSMDITVQEKTFASFMSFVTKGAMFVVAFLVFLYLVNG